MTNRRASGAFAVLAIVPIGGKWMAIEQFSATKKPGQAVIARVVPIDSLRHGPRRKVLRWLSEMGVQP